MTQDSMQSGTRTNDTGAALVVVLVVLMALLAIATPFVASMQLQEHGVRNQVYQQQAVLYGESVSKFAQLRLSQTTARRNDPTPFWDSRAEWADIVPDAEAMGFTAAVDRSGQGVTSLADPYGVVASVEIQDEQSKLNVNSASVMALGALVGSGLLVEPLAADGSEMTLDDASRFPSDGKASTVDGYVWVEGELIGYRHATGNKLLGLERGVLGDDIEFNSPGDHGRNAAVVDARAYFVVRHRVDPERAREGGARYQVMESLSDVRTIVEQKIGEQLPALRGFSHHELEGLRPLLTVHSSRDTRLGFAGGRRVIEVLHQDGQADRLRVLDAWIIATGSVVRLTAPDLPAEYAIVKGRDHGGMVQLDRELLNEYPADQATVEVELRHPVNVNTAPPQVLIASLMGLRTLWDREPRNRGDSAGKGDGGNTVTREEAAAFALEIERYEQANGHPIRHFQDFRDLVDKAIGDEVLSDRDKFGILLNARNPNDPRLVAATVPFIYHSHDVFTIETSVAVNSPAGVPLATHRVREVVELSPPRAAALTFDSQYDFEREVWRGLGYKVDSHPRYVQVWDRTGLPEFFPEMQADLPAQGWLMPMTGEIHPVASSNITVNRREAFKMLDHFDLGWHGGILPADQYTRYEPRPDGLILKDTALVTQAKDQQIVLDPDNAEKDIRAGQVEFWFKPNWQDRRANHVLLDLGQDQNLEFENRIKLFYDGDEQELVFRVADATLDQAATEVRYAVDTTRFANDTWYHLSGLWMGTGLGDLALMVDGQAVGRFEHRTAGGDLLIAKLDSDLSPTASTIDVDNTDGFPAEGVLLIGSEAVLYTQAGQGRFSFTPYPDFAQEPVPDPNDPSPPILPAWLRLGRGARGTASLPHASGTPVVLWGYTSDVRPDYPTNGLGIRRGGASLGENGCGNNTFTIMNTDPLQTVPVTTPPTAIPLWLFKDETELEVPTTSEFPDSGFLIFYYKGPAPAAPPAGSPSSPSSPTGPKTDGIFQDTDPTPGGTPGGTGTGGTSGDVEIFEFVYYKSKDDKKFKDLDRALFNTTAQDFPLNTGVYLISVASDGTPLAEVYAPGGWIQVANEWFRYDQIEFWNGKWYFVKTSGVTQDLADSEEDDGSTGGTGDGTLPGGTSRGTRGGGGGGGGSEQGIFFQDPTPSPTPSPTPAPSGPDPDATDGKRAFEFRGRAYTTEVAHVNGEKIIPVFRLKRPVAGRSDQVTILQKTGQGETKESMKVHWQSMELKPDFTQIPPGSGSGAGTGTGTDPGGFKLPPGTSRGTRGGSAGGGGGGSEIFGPQEGPGPAPAPAAPAAPEYKAPRDMSLAVSEDFWYLAAFDDFVKSAPGNGYPADTTRCLKFPSGELPSRISGSITVAGDMAGKVAPGQIDEVRFSVYGRRRLTVFSAVDLATTAGEIPLSTPANGENPGVVAFKGTEAQPVTGPVWMTPALPTDGGVIRIGHEFVGYRSVNTQQTGVMELGGCERSLWNSGEHPVPAGATAMYLYHLDVTTTGQGGTPFSANVLVRDVKGFPGEGYLSIGKEIVGYSRIDRQLGFVMPVKALDGSGIFRGAYGTDPAAFDSGALVIGMPYRYVDRYQPRADAPEMGYGAVMFQAKDALFTGLRWNAQVPDPQHHAIRLLARVDGRPAWDAEPTNEPGGLYEFTDPYKLGELGVQGDTIEVRVFYEWKPDAYQVNGSEMATQYTSAAWKDSARLLSLDIEYHEPIVVRHREELVR